MANHISHAALPYPIKNARFTIPVPYVASTGVPTDPTTPDTEVSIDAAAFADCTEEVTTISGSNGFGYITLTGAETNASLTVLAAKVASGPNNTLAAIAPRVLAVVSSGTLSAGSAGGGTLGTVLAYNIKGCFIRTTGGTGGGGTGGANNQARKVITYTSSTGAFTVSPNWETTPDATTTYDVLLPEGMTISMLSSLPDAPPGTGGLPLWDQVNTIDDFLDTEVAAIKAKTDNLPSDPADASDIAALFVTVNTKLDTIDDFLDTEVAAIKAKTDNLPSDPADESLIIAATSGILSKLLKYVQLMARSDTANTTDNAAELAEINADGGSGAGDWNPARIVGGAALETLGGILDNVGSVLDDTAISGVVLSTATLNKIADRVLRRTAANAEASVDGDTLAESTLYGILRQLQASNTVDNPGFLTIYKADGTTELAQLALAVDATADPTTGIG